MTYNNKNYKESFSQYLQSMVKLDALEKMTADLDKELADSQNIMKEIRTLFDNIPNAQQQENLVRPRCEQLGQFVEKREPNVLLPDMEKRADAVDIDQIIISMKNYTEKLKSNLNIRERTDFQARNIENLDLSQYAKSLDQLSKSLANVKISPRENNRSAELEGKLEQLCADVTMFTQMVNVNGKLGESVQHINNSTGTSTPTYDTIINKLLSDINEVMYLLQNNG